MHDSIAPSRAHAYAGRSRAACMVRAQMSLFAASDASVLLLGASGTGKELAARIIHDLSHRRPKPFVAIDCGCITDGLAESELFGHVRGAFTGAAGTRQGLFAEADGGTLFLDEIGNASLAFQARLLRVLESREIRAVGANATRPLDVRVIAATNRDLQAEARAGRFRDDLLWRLDVLRLRLPTLAERRHDVPVLARQLLAQVDARSGRHHELSPAALVALEARDWPGNVRELRNAIEHAVAFAGDDETIRPDHLPQHGMPEPSGTRAPTWAEFTAREERTFLLAALIARAWNRTRTAHDLGMSRQALHDRMKRLGIRPTLIASPESFPDAVMPEAVAEGGPSDTTHPRASG